MSNWSFFNGGGKIETLGRVSGDGTTVTSGGGAGTKGSYVSLGTTTFEWGGISLSSSGLGVGRPAQVDIAIGSTPDLVGLDFWSFPNSSQVGISFDIPLLIPSGVSLQMRYASNTSGSGSKWIATGYSNDWLGKAPRKVAQINTMSGGLPTLGPTENGTTLTAWTQLTASTPDAYCGLILQGATISSNIGGAVILDVGVGSSGSEQVIGTAIYSNNNAEPFTDTTFACDIPKGSRISIRVQCAGAAAATFFPSILGIVP